MSAWRHVAFIVGLALIVLILSRLPDDVYATTQTMLLLVSGALLLLFAAGVVLSPSRRLLGRLFGYDVAARAAFTTATGDELRAMLRPVFVALVCLAAAGLPTLLRGT